MMMLKEDVFSLFACTSKRKSLGTHSIWLGLRWCKWIAFFSISLLFESTFAEDNVFIDSLYERNYKIIISEDAKLCHDYISVVNERIGKKLRTPLCNRIPSHLNSNIYGLNWKFINKFEYKEFVSSITEYNCSHIDFIKDKNCYRNQIYKVLESGSSRLLYGEADVDNDGVMDSLVLHEFGSCPDSRLYGSKIYISNKSVTKVLNNTEFIMVHRPNYSSYNIFFHKDKVYIDLWNGTKEEEDYIYVYILTNSNIQLVCSFHAN